MPKQLLNETLVVSAKLEQICRECEDAVLINDMQQLHKALLLYSQALIAEITMHLGTEEKPHIFNANVEEIYPLGLFDFKEVMRAHIFKLAMLTTTLLVRSDSNLLFNIEFIQTCPSTVFFIWKERLAQSNLEQCAVSEVELRRRLEENEENVRAEQKKIQDRATRHAWLLMSAQVAAVIPTFFIPGGALVRVAGRIAVGVVTTTVLHTGFVATDNMVTGESVTNNLGAAAFQGVQAGARNALLGEALGALAGNIIPAPKSIPKTPVEVGKTLFHGASHHSVAVTQTATALQHSSSSMHMTLIAANGFGKEHMPKIMSNTSSSIKTNFYNSEKTENESVPHLMERTEENFFALTIDSDSSKLLEEDTQEVQFHGIAGDTLWAWLANSEIAIFKQISAQNLTDKSPLEVTAKRFEKLLNALINENHQMEADLNEKHKVLQKRVDKTTAEREQFSCFIESAEAWSLQFFTNPKECSLISISTDEISHLKIGETSEKENFTSDFLINEKIHVSTLKPIEPFSALPSFFTNKAEKTIETSEKKMKRLLSIFSEEEQFSERLLEMYNQLEQYNCCAQEQEANLEAEKSNPKLLEWLTWQKEMFKYIKRLQEKTAFTDHTSANSADADEVYLSLGVNNAPK